MRNFIKLSGAMLWMLFTATAYGQSGIVAQPTELTFPGQLINSFSDPQTITLTHQNPGDGVIWTLTLAGDNPRQFSILEDGCSDTVLALNQSCEVQIIYNPIFDLPGGVGASSAVLQVPFNIPPAITVPLSGEGLLPAISADTDGLDFPTTTAGERTDNQPILITNNGAAPLILQLATIAGPDSISFNIEGDECSFQTLNPGDSCLLEIFFRPIAKGDMEAAIVVQSNDPVTPVFSILLAGTGKGSGGCGLSGGAINPFNFMWLLVFAGLGLIRHNSRSGTSR